jgi:hypothetical protein
MSTRHIDQPRHLQAGKSPRSELYDENEVCTYKLGINERLLAKKNIRLVQYLVLIKITDNPN